MKRILRIAALLLFLLPGIAKAQWTFDIVSVEAIPLIPYYYWYVRKMTSGAKK